MTRNSAIICVCCFITATTIGHQTTTTLCNKFCHWFPVKKMTGRKAMHIGLLCKCFCNCIESSTKHIFCCSLLIADKFIRKFDCVCLLHTAPDMKDDSRLLKNHLHYNSIVDIHYTCTCSCVVSEWLTKTCLLELRVVSLWRLYATSVWCLST